VKAAPANLGEDVTIPTPRATRCELKILNTGVTISTASNVKVENIGNLIVRGPTGRYYTSSGQGEIVVWSADGVFQRILGGRGHGPGEFEAGWIAMFIDGTGRLWARDNSRRWSEFKDDVFARTIAAPGTGSDVRRSAFLDNGMFLNAEMNSEQHDFWFHTYKVAPPLQRGEQTGFSLSRSFGPVGSAARGTPSALRGRAIAYVRGATFWAGPPDGSDRGFAIEQWSTDGKLLRTIRRTVTWYPRQSEFSAMGPPQWTLQDDGTGLLFATIAIPRRTSVSRQSPARGRPGGVAVDIYYEVIDVVANEVLFTAGPLPAARAAQELPRLFQGSRQGYIFRSSAQGDRQAVIVEYSLVAR
jgi:hypothetical protein